MLVCVVLWVNDAATCLMGWPGLVMVGVLAGDRLRVAPVRSIVVFTTDGLCYVLTVLSGLLDLALYAFILIVNALVLLPLFVATDLAAFAARRLLILA